MPYTNVWTTAAPLDTQAANQGAVDFRATKLDVMQRIASFGAGVLASRPTPEVTSASANWTGVMYWATDTKQVFRWNGSSWDNISADIPTIGASVQKFTNVTPVTLTDNGTAQDGQIISLPGNTLTASSIVIINSMASVVAGQSNPFSKLGLFFGGFLLAELRSDGLAPGSFVADQSVWFNSVITGVSGFVQQSYGTSSFGSFTGPSGGNYVDSMGNSPGATVSGGIDIKNGIEGGINSGTVITFANLSVLVFN